MQPLCSISISFVASFFGVETVSRILGILFCVETFVFALTQFFFALKQYLFSISIVSLLLYLPFPIVRLHGLWPLRVMYLLISVFVQTCISGIYDAVNVRGIQGGLCICYLLLYIYIYYYHYYYLFIFCYFRPFGILISGLELL